jgi:hypothetical protein
MDADELTALIGRKLPEGGYRIEPGESAMLRHAVYAEPDPQPHPIYAFVAGQGGLGISVDELLELFGTTAAEGPLLGECRLELPGDLEVGQAYRVTGEILDARRKHGRQLGTFDVITFQVELADLGGSVVARCRETFVVPRAGGQTEVTDG